MITIGADGTFPPPDTVAAEVMKIKLARATEALGYALANLEVIVKTLSFAEKLAGQPGVPAVPPHSAASLDQHRSERISKLLLLDILVPICVKKRTTDILIPHIDPARFHQTGTAWGIWRMDEDEFSQFEERKLQKFTRKLSKVSADFPLRMFTLVDTIISVSMKAAK
jgi:hypothetical protein